MPSEEAKSISVSKMSALILKNRELKSAKFVTSPKRSKIRAFWKSENRQTNILSAKLNKQASIKDQNTSNETKNEINSSKIRQSADSSVTKFVEKDNVTLR